MRKIGLIKKPENNKQFKSHWIILCSNENMHSFCAQTLTTSMDNDQVARDSIKGAFLNNGYFCGIVV